MSTLGHGMSTQQHPSPKEVIRSMSESAINPAAMPRESVSAVYRRIRRMILSGALESGQSISQVKFASDFRTSRGPVREALRMLQCEGLVEAATNQRGRVVAFSPGDLEQVCALLVINVGASIAVGDGLFTTNDIERINRQIDLIERLADPEEVESPAQAARRILRRRIAFRRLIILLCRHAGPQAVQLVNGLLDRIALFRHMHELMGDSPPYPLANRFTDLREASARFDGRAMAAIVVRKIAEVSRKALQYVAENYQPALLDTYAELAEMALNGRSFAETSQSTEASEITIRVRIDPDSKLVYTVGS